MKPVVLAFIVFATRVLAGCSQTNDTDEKSSADAKSALMGENSLTTNAIVLNGLLTNAIDLNGIDATLLSGPLLEAIQDSGEVGVNSRLLYKYLVSCAFDPSQSVSFSWTDASSVVHNEVYWGGIGLAPQWKELAIDGPARRSLSACLGARTNFYGIPVMISMRGPQSVLQDPSTEEKTAYPLEEGVFWGDVFTTPPQLYSCHNSANMENSRSHLRECAAGHVADAGPPVECGYIAILGDCDTVCAAPNPIGLYRHNCNEGEGPTSNVVTVFLPQ